MGITRKGGRWIFVKRVPRRFAHLDRRTFARIALGTDSRAEALAKAPAVEAELWACWEALAAGRTDDARRRHDAAKALAEARGFRYLPHDVLAAGDLDTLVERLAAIEHATTEGAFRPVAEALTGEIEPPPVALSQVLSEYFELTADRIVGKSERQVHRWRLPRLRAVASFVEVVGDRPVGAISTDDALTFRRHWQGRVTAGEILPHTANKTFGHLSDIVRTWAELNRAEVANPFAGLQLRDPGGQETPPYSAAFIRGRLLAPGALDGLNATARDSLLVMVNTGARPSEILNAEPEDFRLDAPVPHLAIVARPGRELKTRHSAREIPLLGVSLDAARRIAGAGGCARYRDKGGAWSAAVNKFLRDNGLRETPAHSAYSLRHAFEDRLLEAGVDHRLRVELMGHKYDRPRYGEGGSLELKRKALALIAF